MGGKRFFFEISVRGYAAAHVCEVRARRCYEDLDLRPLPRVRSKQGKIYKSKDRFLIENLLEYQYLRKNDPSNPSKKHFLVSPLI